MKSVHLTQFILFLLSGSWSCHLCLDLLKDKASIYQTQNAPQSWWWLTPSAHNSSLNRPWKLTFTLKDQWQTPLTSWSRRDSVQNWRLRVKREDSLTSLVSLSFWCDCCTVSGPVSDTKRFYFQLSAPQPTLEVMGLNKFYSLTSQNWPPVHFFLHKVAQSSVLIFPRAEIELGIM